MGLMYLASYLRSFNRGRNIRIIDMVLEALTPEEILPILKEFQPDICGISCLTMNANNSLRISELIKKWNPKCSVILGGPHPTFMPDKVLESHSIDFCVMGEGEKTAHLLISALENNEPYEPIEGIGYRIGDSITLKNRPSALDITCLPWPAYDLISAKKYWRSKIPSHSGRVKYAEYMTVMSSRACPYGCIYCHNILEKNSGQETPKKLSKKW